jgi:hypothetical protein
MATGDDRPGASDQGTIARPSDVIVMGKPRQGRPSPASTYKSPGLEVLPGIGVLDPAHCNTVREMLMAMVKVCRQAVLAENGLQRVQNRW